MAKVNSSSIFEKFNDVQIRGQNSRKDLSFSNQGDYRINELMYPDDLTQSPDLQHYVAFYINIRDRSKFNTAKVNKVNVSVDADSQGRNQSSNENLKQVAGGAATIGAFGAGAGLYSSQFSQVTKRGAINRIKASGAVPTKASVFREVVATGIAVGAASGLGAAAVTGLARSFSDTLKTDVPKRISDVIVLPIEQRPSVRYSVNYRDDDLGFMGGLFGGSSAVDSSNMGKLGESAIRILGAIGNIPKIAGLSSPTQAEFLGSKVATNPFKEVFFESIGFRTFSFAYTFLPKNETEVYNVKRIIDMFKFHMHPELSSDGLFYIYPSEFEVVYYFKGKENNFMNKISTCVLKDIEVNYGGEYFSSFQNGSPAEISLKLVFQETELMVKERIVKGF